ncbi:peptidyl-prolyl cis-trans isomerase [Wenzhouxiangella sp. XN79A]|uniref:peptidylprolyl isomerase n=1 Tax=Wenzhouxiangella sp. XN79A TaxID=2724193 RepID=UPI00144AE87E|nr:peptidylprolyl isomerase [Wenzhouxiangella sp. XN79A]NKI33710.1 peptidyl-prolyl cis-trans isomerase [Wenzhouxiangella sp. XN79A]
MKFVSLLPTLLLLSSFAARAQDDAAPAGDNPFAQALPTVVLHTSMGPITLELFEDDAPISTENFLAYARDGHYDGTIFHRVIGNFMIQGGGFDADLDQKPTRDPITNEADNGLKNARGTVAMARTGMPHSATAQFFINVVDNPALDHRGTQSGRTWGYAVFARVTEGMDVVDAIRAVETAPRPPHQNVPVEPVIIERVEISAGSD